MLENQYLRHDFSFLHRGRTDDVWKDPLDEILQDCPYKREDREEITSYGKEMPLPVLVAVAIGAVATVVVASSLVTAALLHLKKAKEKLRARPRGTPLVPPGMTPPQLLAAARERLGMDVQNYFNFAFCGGSGSGKSSLINAMRNRDDIDYVEGTAHDMFGSAPTGNWQTTMETRCYAFPANDELRYVRLWDMPGSGTHEHPSVTYYEDKALFAFDVLLLVVEKELGEYEYAILERAQREEKPVVIVVTKAETKIESLLRRRSRGRNASLDEYKQAFQAVQNEAWERIRASLIKRSVRIPETFVVSAWKYRDLMMHTDHGLQMSREESNGQSASLASQRDEEEIEKAAALSLELTQMLAHIAETAVRCRH